MNNGVRVNFGGNVVVPFELCDGDEDKAQNIIKNVLNAICGVYDSYWEEEPDKESQCVVWVSE